MRTNVAEPQKCFGQLPHVPSITTGIWPFQWFLRWRHHHRGHRRLLSACAATAAREVFFVFNAERMETQIAVWVVRLLRRGGEELVPSASRGQHRYLVVVRRRRIDQHLLLLVLVRHHRLRRIAPA